MVADDTSDAAYRLIEDALAKLGGLDVSYERYDMPEFTRQKVYHIKGSPRYPMIDCNVEEARRNFVFTRGVDDVRVVFDKGGYIKFQDLDPEKLRQEIRNGFAEAEKAYYGFRPNVEKQYLRGKFIEAFGYYHTYVLQPLVWVLRMAYSPAWSGDYYYIKDIYRHLPPDITKQLEELYKVAAISDFEARIRKADELFEAAAS